MAKEMFLSPEEMKAYAELLIYKGINIQKGQALYIVSPAEVLAFTRVLTQTAYEAGSGHVTVSLVDDQLKRLEYQNNPLEYFDKAPAWEALRSNSLAKEGAAFLFLDGEDPSVFEGIDPKKPALALKRRNESFADYRQAVDFGKTQWLIAGVATKAWAKAVFPQLDEESAVAKLWETILKIARADGENPQKAWDDHRFNLEKHMAFLNECRFEKLHYTNSKGTDLYIHLPEKHIWQGGGAETVDGIYFYPNMPTEEVFTTPHRNGTEGIVYSALPLAYGGEVIRDFWFKFEKGAVVDYGAAEGKDVLDQLLATDEGAKYLGEVALVPKDSPIRESNLLFYSILFDENASCHLALGMGYADAYEGGLEMEKAALLEAGVNDSATHVDFMIGTEDLHIDGITSDGKVITIFENGTWA
ncbi:MAG: aminopeptidase [Coriobacteriia bacterium]|nr:aminopeptidase [Coriobacteriia bacterium]